MNDRSYDCPNCGAPGCSGAVGFCPANLPDQDEDRFLEQDYEDRVSGYEQFPDEPQEEGWA